MKNRMLLGFLVCLAVTLTGCPSAPPSAVENAEQSAIDAYKAAQAEDQAAMDASLGDSSKKK